MNRLARVRWMGGALEMGGAVTVRTLTQRKTQWEMKLAASPMAIHRVDGMANHLANDVANHMVIPRWELHASR